MNISTIREKREEFLRSIEELEKAQELIERKTIALQGAVEACDMLIAQGEQEEAAAKAEATTKAEVVPSGGGEELAAADSPQVTQQVEESPD